MQVEAVVREAVTVSRGDEEQERQSPMSTGYPLVWSHALTASFSRCDTPFRSYTPVGSVSVTSPLSVTGAVDSCMRTTTFALEACAFETAAQLQRLVGLSEKTASDAGFARQARRKFVP